MTGAADGAGRGRTAELVLRTPEGVAFTLRLASPVARLAALMIDMMAVAAAWSVGSVVIALLGVVSEDLARGVAVVSFFVLSQGYRIAAEWLWRGQTVGKRVMRLRVVDGRGLPLGFAQVVLRNLIRFLDALPVAYGVGGACALLNRRGQRLGDLVADTLVVWEPAEPRPDYAVMASGRYNSLRAQAPAVARLRQAVTPAVARVAWQALARRDGLEDGARVALFAELAAHFRGLTPLPEEAVAGLSDEQLVRNVVDVLFLSRAVEA